jgi:hypothetical protein
MGHGWDFVRMFGGMGIGMAIFVVLFFMAFFGVIGLFIYRVASVGRAKAKMAAAPEVQAQGRVVDKRVETLSPGHTGVAELGSPNVVEVPMGDGSAWQLYKVTFEQAGGERFELSVPPEQYGLIIEGDSGTVTMKGGDLLSFSRELLR